MWSVEPESITQGPRKGDWERQVNELAVCTTRAMLLVDFHVSHYFLKSSNVTRNGSGKNVKATCDIIVK